MTRGSATKTVTSVDQNFVRFGGKSYAINKINSVEVRTFSPYSRGSAKAALFGAALLIYAGTKTPNGAFLLAVGALLLGLGIHLWRRGGVVRYALFLMTSSSENEACVSDNEGEIMALRQRIEEEMARR